MSNSDIGRFVERNSARVTPRVAQNMLARLPMLKVEFTQIDDPAVPHLSEQLEFLADVVEDFLEGAEKDLPFYAVAAACFAIIYAHEVNDVIPDYVEGFGHLDDSAIVRYVLIRYETWFRGYADKIKIPWSKITTAA